MAYLARNYQKGSVSASSIAKDEKISIKYLERIISILKRTGLIKAAKGSAGGYSLAKNPKQINILSIVRVLEGGMSPFYCIDDKGKIYCSRKCRCGVTGVLAKVQTAINTTLEKIKLSDLI